MNKAFANRVEAGNFDDDLSRVKDMDWVIEVVIERLDIKQDLYAKIEKYRGEHTVISSNTSTIPLEKLVEGAMNKMKAALGNKVDWSYYNQMQYGLAASTNYEASINILTHFATKLNSEVIPIYKAHLNNQTIQVPHDTSTPPKGGGFQAIPWHPRVINGNYYHPVHKMTIRG